MTPASISAIIESVHVDRKRTRITLALGALMASHLRASGAYYRGPVDSAEFVLSAESLRAVFTKAIASDGDRLTLTAETPHVQARGFVYLVGERVTLTVRPAKRDERQTVIPPLREPKAKRSKFTIEIEGQPREVELVTT